MSDPKREKHPLLGDDLSEDECLPDSPKYQRCYTNKIRTKNCLRGAASILKQWPDHVSSLLAYWWMGLAMIGFTALILYNSVLAIAVIPSPKISKVPAHIKPNEFYEYEAYKTVNMHVIVDNISFDPSTYIPYIEIMSKEHPVFKYNFIILLNDTNYSNNKLNVMAKEMSTKSISKDANKLSLQTKINVERKSLSEFLNNSPLRKYWRYLPQKFLGFLIRCIAIWNKGGISINPQLLTPESPHHHYIDKLRGIFRRFESTTKEGHKKSNNIKRVNNIRDIIDALEPDNFDVNQQLPDVNVAEENKEFLVLARNSSDFIQRNISVNKNTVNKTLVTAMNIRPVNKLSTKDDFFIDSNQDGKKLFPMFLKFLFSPKTNISHRRDNGDINELSDSYENVVQKKTIKRKKYLYKENIPGEIKNIPMQSLHIDYDLNIDLKGNIVATKTSCHAFLGTVFNTAIHHIKDETVTDFIISELSTFCKGNWIYCKGVDIILL